MQINKHWGSIIAILAGAFLQVTTWTSAYTFFNLDDKTWMVSGAVAISFLLTYFSGEKAWKIAMMFCSGFFLTMFIIMGVYLIFIDSTMFNLWPLVILALLIFTLPSAIVGSVAGLLLRLLVNKLKKREVAE